MPNNSPEPAPLNPPALAPLNTPEPKPIRTPRATRTPTSPSTRRIGSEAEASPPPPPVLLPGAFKLEAAPGVKLDFYAGVSENVFKVMAQPDIVQKIITSTDEKQQLVSIDIPYKSTDRQMSANRYSINADVLSGVEISRPDQRTLRVLLEIRPDVSIVTEKGDGEIAVFLKNKLIPNIGYHKNGERVFITLYQTILMTSGETPIEYYKLSSSDNERKWTLTFENERNNLGVGIANIGDELINAVETRKSGNKTTLLITTKIPVKLTIYSKQVSAVNLQETTISIIRPAAKTEKLVVIDAGHGGHDPGAVGFNGKNEKDFALDMAVKLKDKLSDVKGLRVFLTRDDDYFVDLYERAALANAINADLFISIHANASVDNPAAAGAETLYCPSKADAGFFTGQSFAELTQKRLVKAVKSYDRGVKPRPNLVVLRRTDMPAIIVETAFITNASDLTNLSRVTFRKSVAGALADSIEEALSALIK